MVSLPGGETVTIFGPPSGLDPYGDPLSSAEDPPLVVSRCAVAPVSSERLAAGSLTSITDEQLDVFFPAGVDLDGVTRVEVRGVLWEPLGFPAVWRSPFTGVEVGQVLTVRRVTS